MLREDGQVFVLADSTGKEIRVPRQSVEAHMESPMSLMPGNMADQLSEGEFSALLAYLLSRTQR